MNSSNESLTGKTNASRLFVAVALPTDQRRKLEEYTSRLRERSPKCRAAWVRPENFHLTLRFLGDTPMDQVTKIGQVLDEAVSNVHVFNLSIARTGTFNSGRSNVVLWIGFAGDLEILNSVKAGVDLGLAKFNIKQERVRFNPHLTIARIRDADNCGALIQAHKNAEIKQFDFDVRELLLIKGDLDPNGARYSVVHRSPFTAKLQ
ncbi:MAG: RNA 2',3'-cyclic phosphodiesterase [Acidobacteriota bacterium]